MQRKVRALKHSHPGLRGAQLRQTATTTSSTAAEVLDVTAIAKATRAISGELELERLLARMLEIIFENAGAEGGALILDEGTGLTVAASRTAGDSRIVTAGIPLADAALPRSVIHYVHRTDAAVVLDDAIADPRFGSDDHIRLCAPRSVLCMPVKHKDRLLGMLYFENNTPVQFVSDHLTFIGDVLPSMLDTITRYRALVTAVEAPGDVTAALADVHDAEAAADIDYALGHTPTALASALDGLGRVAAIVRAMKDFAHPDRDEKTLVDLDRAIESTLMIAAHEYKYVADLRTELAALPAVRCNAGQINQVVLNLVINAAHTIRDVVGDSGARGQIVVRTRQLDGEVEISVSDTGTGIPEAIRDKVYDPFFTTKDVGRGTGQGLAIARNVVVDKHGGSLRFETQLGAGTSFFLRLPVGDAPE